MARAIGSLSGGRMPNPQPVQTRKANGDRVDGASRVLDHENNELKTRKCFAQVPFLNGLG